MVTVEFPLKKTSDGVAIGGAVIAQSDGSHLPMVQIVGDDQPSLTLCYPRCDLPTALARVRHELRHLTAAYEAGADDESGGGVLEPV